MRCCSAAMDILLAAMLESPRAAPLAGFASAFCRRFMRSLHLNQFAVRIRCCTELLCHAKARSMPEFRQHRRSLSLVK